MRDVLIWRMDANDNVNADIQLSGMPASDAPAEEIGNCFKACLPTPALCLACCKTAKCRLDVWFSRMMQVRA